MMSKIIINIRKIIQLFSVLQKEISIVLYLEREVSLFFLEGPPFLSDKAKLPARPGTAQCHLQCVLLPID